MSAPPTQRARQSQSCPVTARHHQCTWRTASSHACAHEVTAASQRSVQQTCCTHTQQPDVTYTGNLPSAPLSSLRNSLSSDTVVVVVAVVVVGRGDRMKRWHTYVCHKVVVVVVVSLYQCASTLLGTAQSQCKVAPVLTPRSSECTHTHTHTHSQCQSIVRHLLAGCAQ